MFTDARQRGSQCLCAFVLVLGPFFIVPARARASVRCALELMRE